MPCKQLEREKLHAVVAKQMARSATAIGAAYAEASEAESADDFIHKMKLALKEAKETRYWLDLVGRSIHVRQEVDDSLTSIQKLLARSIATAIRNRELKRKK